MHTVNLFFHQLPTDVAAAEDVSLRIGFQFSELFWFKPERLPRGVNKCRFEKWFSDRADRLPLGMFIRLLCAVDRWFGRQAVRRLLQIIADRFELDVVERPKAVVPACVPDALRDLHSATSRAAVVTEDAAADGVIDEKEAATMDEAMLAVIGAAQAARRAR